MDDMLSIHTVSKMIGVTVKTLKIWDNENKLKSSFRTVGGHRRYKLSDIEEFIGQLKDNKERVFIYCRVSTKKQAESGNLIRQEERLLSYCQNKGYEVINVYKEIASGINDKRAALMKMFERLPEVNRIIIECNDRLARFGYNYLKTFARTYNVEIETIEENEKLAANEEMVNDLVSVVTCFSAKIYGARGGRKIKKTIEELEKERLGGPLDENHN